MLNYVSDSISDFLCKNEIIKNEEKAVYTYGFKLLISAIIGFLLIVLIGIISGRMVEVMIFNMLFVTIRFHCGGYHAETYLKCGMVFIGICVGGLVLTNLMQIIHN